MFKLTTDQFVNVVNHMNAIQEILSQAESAEDEVQQINTEPEQKESGVQMSSDLL